MSIQETVDNVKNTATNIAEGTFTTVKDAAGNAIEVTRDAAGNLVDNAGNVKEATGGIISKILSIFKK